MCRVGVSRKLWKTISFLWTGGQWGVVAISVIYLAIPWEGEEQKRRLKWETVHMQRHWAVIFSQLWEIRGPERDREVEWGEEKLLRDSLHPDCAVTAYRAAFLSLSPLLPVTDDTSQEDPGDSLQVHIHLRPNLSRTLSISSHQLFAIALSNLYSDSHNIVH